MPAKTRPPRATGLDPERVRDTSVKIYRYLLGKQAADAMLAKDNDGGAKFRKRARVYDKFTRAYLIVLGGVKP